MVTIDKVESDLQKALHDSQQFYKYMLEDHGFKTNKGMTVRFTDRGFRELFHAIENVMAGEEFVGKGATKVVNQNAHEIDSLLATIQKLDDVVKDPQFHFEYEAPNRKRDRKPDILSYEHFTCPITINGKRRKLMLTFERKVDDRKRRDYYYHYLSESVHKLYESLYLISANIS